MPAVAFPERDARSVAIAFAHRRSDAGAEPDLDTAAPLAAADARALAIAEHDSGTVARSDPRAVCAALGLTHARRHRLPRLRWNP